MLWRKDCVTSQKNVCVGGYIPRDPGAMWSDCDVPVRYLKGAPPPLPTHCNPSEGRKVVYNQREYSPYNCSAFFQTSLASLKLCLTKTLFVFSKRTKMKVFSHFASAITRNRRRPFGTSRDINLSWKAASQLSVNLLNSQAVLNLVVNPLFISTFFFIYFPGQTFRSLYMIILRG